MNIAKLSTFFYNKKLYNDMQTAYKTQYESVENIKTIQEEKFKNEVPLTLIVSAVAFFLLIAGLVEAHVTQRILDFLIG